MHITKTDHPVNHIDRLRRQFALLGQDTFCKALGSDQAEQILREEVGPYREQIYVCNQPFFEYSNCAKH